MDYKLNSKFNYKISNTTLKLVTVNRQQSDKNPENIIKAIKNIDCEYYLVGDGAYHVKLKKLAQNLKISHKVHFIKSIDNKDLIDFITTFDIFISNTDVYGVSKGVIEASLAGLPIITNDFPDGSSMDLNKNDFVLCKNTPSDFRKAILLLKNNKKLRIQYSASAKQFSKNNFDPEIMENKIVSLYKQIIEKT